MALSEPTFIQHLGPQFSRFVADQLGLSFPPERWAEMWRGLCCACPELGFNSPEECLESILNSPLDQPRAEVLASHLTIGETYFFRDLQSFEVLQQQLLPQLLTQRKELRFLRLWSAGCATGEEAYSIAMLLHHFFPETQSWRVTILGTDINPRSLQKANQGLYTEWSFRGTPSWVKANYFTKTSANSYQIADKIRDMVTFSYLNLAQDTFPSILNGTNAIDLIFCRNVLMYFRPETAANVVLKFHRSLVEDGWLSVSPYDVSHLKPDLFSHSPELGIAFHHKTAATLQAPQRANPVPPVGDAKANRIAPHPRRTAAFSRPPRRKQQAPSSLEIARRHFLEGDYLSVVSMLSPYVKKRPADSPAVELLARALANCGQLDESLQCCDKGLVVDQLNPSLHFLRATVLQEQGQTERAVQDLRRVLYLDPAHLLAHFGLGNILHFQHRFAEANRHYQQALNGLSRLDRNLVLPEFDGMTVGRLQEVIDSMMHLETVE